MSFVGFEWNLSGTSILKSVFSALTGNLISAVLSVITGIKLNLIFALANHGIFPVYIPDLKYDLSVNGIKIGQGNSNVDLTINPGETKDLPILQDFTFNSLEPVASSVIASNGIMDVKVSGTAYFKFLGLSIPVPFESTKQVSVVDEVKKYISGKLSDQSSSSYQTPSIQTSISFQSSIYSVYQGQSVTFSGHLIDSNGNGIANQLIYVKRDISFSPDSVLGYSYTDSSGYFSVDWIATKPITSNTADVYATFEGNSGYTNARSGDISVQIYIQQTQPTTQNPQSSLDQQLQQARQKIQSSQQTYQSPTSITIVNTVYKVGPGTYTYIPFSMSCTASVSGSFSASAALGDNIITYVLDQNNFQQLQANRQASTYYNSGKVSSGSFSLNLQPGQYYIILSNSYSSFSTKTVDIAASYTCS